MSTVKQHHIYNIAITSANTEYSQALPNHTKRLRVTAYDSNKRYPHSDVLKICFSSGSNAIISVFPSATYGGYGGGVYEISDVDLDGKTVYVQSPTGSAIGIIEAWT